MQRHRATGSPSPGNMGGHKPRRLTGEHRDWLLERTKTDFTLRGLCAELAERGITVDYRAVWSFAHNEGLSFKKSVLPAEQLRSKIARRREQWKKYQGRIDPKRLVFIDETWAKTNMAPLRGWATKGQRLQRQSALWSLENNDIPRCLALRPDRCTLRSRSTDQR